jgi:hypothetical protein
MMISPCLRTCTLHILIIGWRNEYFVQRALVTRVTDQFEAPESQSRAPADPLSRRQTVLLAEILARSGRDQTGLRQS